MQSPLQAAGVHALFPSSVDKLVKIPRLYMQNSASSVAIVQGSAVDN